MSSKHPQNLPGSDFRQPIQKRASQACHQCRLRKVKCNLVETGPPCHNCRFDDSDCITSLSRRSRKYRLQKRQPIHTRTSEPLSLPQTQRVAPFASSTASRSSEAARNVPIRSNYRHGSPSALSDLGSDAQSSIVPILSTEKNLQAKTSDTSSKARRHLNSMSLPSYIRSPQRDIQPDELEFLKGRGAFSIPEPALRDELLRSFVLYVNPFLPVLDVQGFLNAIEGESGSEISLILFQAVMFAGTAFVDDQILLDAGFESRVAARTYFFYKVKLLHDFDWETDRIVLIQATLLHAYWYISGNDQKDPWYWLGICISLATSLGLNQESTYADKDANTCRLWRRIWWTCVSRDRITCITTRKPIRIKDEDINLSRLKFKDFDTQPYSTKIRLLQDTPLATDCVGKVMLADMFMSKVNILLIIGRIISHLYFLQGFVGSTSDWTMFYIPKRRGDLDSSFTCRLQAELNNWSNTLNSYCQMGYQDDDTHEPQTSVMRVHRAVLKLLHAMAQEALHRPQTFSRLQPSAQPDADSPTNRSRASVRQAASDICDVLQAFREQNLLRYVPPLSIGCIIAAIASFLFEIRLEKKSPAELPSHPFHQCVRSLLKLGEVWPIAEGSVSMVNQMMARNQVVFAWNFRMLSKPLGLNETAEDIQTNAETQQRRSQLQMGGTDTEGTGQLASHLNNGVDSTYVDFNPVPPTYRAFMYPFPWTTAEFDYYDEFNPIGSEFFAEHGMDGYDINSALCQ